MANEATIRSALQIRKAVDGLVVMDYQSRPAAFQADVDDTKGPLPGAMTVGILGKDVDLSELETPGLCRIMNQDDENFVEYGIRDPETDFFYPLGELLPGESYVLRLSRNLEQEYIGTGTGTSPGMTNKLHLKANTAPCVVLVEAFGR